MLNPTLKTPRLTLRPYQQSDAPELRARIDNLAIIRMLARVPYPYSEEDAARWIGTHDSMRAEATGYPFAIMRDSKLLGTVSIEHDVCGVFELGYWLAETVWNKGYMTEAVRAVLSFAFDELGLAYVRSRHIADNRASARVLAKTGFLATGRSRQFHPVRESEVEMINVILLRDAFIRDDGGAKQVYKTA